MGIWFVSGARVEPLLHGQARRRSLPALIAKWLTDLNLRPLVLSHTVLGPFTTCHRQPLTCGNSVRTLPMLSSLVESLHCFRGVNEGNQLRSPARHAHSDGLVTTPLCPGKLRPATHGNCCSKESKCDNRWGSNRGGPDVAQPEPHSCCSGADHDADGRAPTRLIANSAPTVHRSAARLS
jgi:hypothetical protein